MYDAFPIGTILGFAGATEDQQTALDDAGWVRCDGFSFEWNAPSAQALRDVIQGFYGGGDPQFHVPNLKGYFLRGVDPDGKVDTEAAARTPHNPDFQPSGLAGANVGSVQAHAIGPHGHSIWSYPGTRGSESGDGHGCIWYWPTPAQPAATAPYGYSETRPVNMSIHFLIKWKQVHDVPPVLPGMVVFFAGPITDDPLQRQGWLPCDGRAYDPLGPFKPLFDTIANRYGGTSTGQLCVPDYQGVFLRGVDLGRGKDPDRLTRLPPRPDLPDSGNGGDNPGSWQAHQIGSHTHPYTWQNYNYTTSTVDYCDDFLWQTGQEWTSGPAGGCGETRPRNKSLHHLVSWSATPPEPAVPPGTVIAYAGLPSSVTDPAWLPCDGRVLDQQAYPALFSAVGRAHGGDATTFRLPDLRGWFVRGVDCGRLVDTDAAERLAPAPGGNSGDAVGSVQFDDFTSHTHQYYFSNGEQVKATTRGSVPMVIYPGQTHQLTADPGQGQQTRPVNAYVHFLIRVS